MITKLLFNTLAFGVNFFNYFEKAGWLVQNTNRNDIYDPTKREEYPKSKLDLKVIEVLKERPLTKVETRFERWLDSYT